MAAKRREFLYDLDEDCRYRQEHLRIGKRIVGFSAQVEVKVRGEWRAVVRYDTTHGFAHQDVMHYHGKREKQPLPFQDYNEALNYAESDLKTNWWLYRERFLKEVM